jgi:hypothetical protein
MQTFSVALRYEYPNIATIVLAAQSAWKYRLEIDSQTVPYLPT